MKICYTGPKKSKTVNFGGKEVVFNPTAEFNSVFDKPAIDWLLHPDRNNLFVVKELEDPTKSVLEPHITDNLEEKEGTEAPIPDETPEEKHIRVTEELKQKAEAKAKRALAKRAKKVGLPEDASEEDILAKEKEIESKE